MQKADRQGGWGAALPLLLAGLGAGVALTLVIRRLRKNSGTGCKLPRGALRTAEKPAAVAPEGPARAAAPDAGDKVPAAAE
jgi:hypothetical protein